MIHLCCDSVTFFFKFHESQLKQLTVYKLKHLYNHTDFFPYFQSQTIWKFRKLRQIKGVSKVQKYFDPIMSHTSQFYFTWNMNYITKSNKLCRSARGGAYFLKITQGAFWQDFVYLQFSDFYNSFRQKNLNIMITKSYLRLLLNEILSKCIIVQCFWPRGIRHIPEGCMASKLQLKIAKKIAVYRLDCQSCSKCFSIQRVWYLLMF